MLCVFVCLFWIHPGHYFQGSELHIPSNNDGIHIRSLFYDIRRGAHVQLVEERSWHQHCWESRNSERHKNLHFGHLEIPPTLFFPEKDHQKKVGIFSS